MPAAWAAPNFGSASIAPVVFYTSPGTGAGCTAQPPNSVTLPTAMPYTYTATDSAASQTATTLGLGCVSFSQTFCRSPPGQDSEIRGDSSWLFMLHTLVLLLS